MLVVSWIHPLSDTFDIFLIHPHSIFLLGDVIADHPVALLHTKPLSIETQQLSNNDDKSSVSKDSDTSSDTSPSTSANKNTASTTTKRRRNSKTSASREALRRSANDGSIEITFPLSVSSSSSMSSSAVTASPSTLYYTSDLMWAARDIESGQSSHYIMLVGGCTFNNKNRKTETVRC